MQLICAQTAKLPDSLDPIAVCHNLISSPVFNKQRNGFERAQRVRSQKRAAFGIKPCGAYKYCIFTETVFFRRDRGELSFKTIV